MGFWGDEKMSSRVRRERGTRRGRQVGVFPARGAGERREEGFFGLGFVVEMDENGEGRGRGRAAGGSADNGVKEWRWLLA